MSAEAIIATSDEGVTATTTNTYEECSTTVTTSIPSEEGVTEATPESISPTPASEKKRMYAEDVMLLKDTINPKIRELLQSFNDKYPKTREAVDVLREIIDLVETTDPNSKSPPVNLAQAKRITIFDTGDLVPSSSSPSHSPSLNPSDIMTPNTNPIRDASKMKPIDVEQLTHIPRAKMDLLMEKVFGLINMMENALNGIDEEPYLSIGSIKNVGMSLFRRVFYVANMEAINTQFQTEVYPFIEVEEKLLNIMKDVFLKMFFSPLRRYLVPYYVHAAVELCTYKEIKFKQFQNRKEPYYDMKQEHRLPVRMNKLYPCKNERITPLHIINIRKSVNELARSFTSTSNGRSRRNYHR